MVDNGAIREHTGYATGNTNGLSIDRLQNRSGLGIDEAMEQDFAKNTLARHWSQEVNNYRERKTAHWRADVHGR